MSGLEFKRDGLKCFRFLLICFSLFFTVNNHVSGGEIEVRSGVSVGDRFGLHVGAYYDIPLSGIFSIQTGALLHTTNDADRASIGVNAPVYASFHLPVSQSAKIRLNCGAFVGASKGFDAGFTADAGVEWKRFYTGINYFHDFTEYGTFHSGISFGYRF